ncbi:hypothetical protein [Porphyromonas sp.]|uniref:hypothetical protein n=1 Tax=Porphyromonas sp. TaxID=1924944 RepID=UPI0025DCE744|nr:hypothetical protein [Porphyromonas sp.]
MRRYLLLLYSLLLSLIPLGSMAQKASENVLSFTTSTEPGKKISLIIVAEEPVIMDGLKDTVTAPWWFDYTLTKSTVTITGNVRTFSGAFAGLTQFSAANNKALEELTLSYNRNLTSVDITGCSALTKVQCSTIGLNKSGLDALIASLPDATGRKYKPIFSPHKYDTGPTELNWDIESIRAVNAKGWRFFGDYTRDLTDQELYPDEIKMEREAADNTDFALGVRSAGTSLPIFTNLAGTSVLWHDTQSHRMRKAGAKITVGGSTVSLECFGNKLTKLELGEQHCLEELYCYKNLLTELDFSGCDNLKKVMCKGNLIKGEATSRLMASLPDRSSMTEKGRLYFVDWRLKEDNKYTDADIIAANKRGWAVFYTDTQGGTHEIIVSVPKNVITFKTNRAVGETIQIDFNNAGKEPIVATGLNVVNPVDSVKSYTLTDQTITLTGDISDLEISNNDCTALSIQNHTTLVQLYFYDNSISNPEISNCPKLAYVDCSNNGMSAESLHKLIKALPDWSAGEYYCELAVDATYSDYVKNVYDDSHIDAAYSKKWRLMTWLTDSDNEECLKSDVPVIRMQTELPVNSGKYPQVSVRLTYVDDLLALDGLETLDGAEISSSDQMQTLKVTSKNLRIGGNVVAWGMPRAQLSSITMPKHQKIEMVDVRENQIQTFDFSECPNLVLLCFAKNGLKADVVTRLIDNLPNRSAEAVKGELRLFDTFKGEGETNEVTSDHVRAANAKGWRITDATQEITVELLGTDLVLRPQESDNTVYTLDGIRLFTPVDELPEGIYIIGGKKVIIDHTK